MSVIVTGFGAPALDALRRTLSTLRGDDPLAPVDVAVPSGFVGVTARRRLADPGLAGVRFAPLPRLIAERAAWALAADGRQPLTATHRRVLTRAVLATRAGPLGDSARRSPSTVDVVTGVFAELDDLCADARTLAVLDAAGRWPREVTTLYRDYVGAAAGLARPDRVVEAALAGPPGPPIVVYLPRRLSGAELRFCAGLLARGGLHAIVAWTGEEAADVAGRRIVRVLQPGTPAPAASVPVPAGTRALPDAEEEARFALRRSLEHLARDGARADRVGIAYRATVPYARLVSEQLSAAGLAHHAPSQRTLAQTVPGRTLLGLLDLPEQRWSRAAVMDWLRDAPVRDGTARLPVSQWHRIAGEAGVTRGRPQQWADRLERFAQRIEPAVDAEDPGRPAQQAASARRLAGLVTGLAGRVDEVVTAPTWQQAGGRLRAALEHYLGGPQSAAGWGGHPHAKGDAEVGARAAVERAAYEQTLAVLDRLDALDEAGLDVDPQGLRDVLEEELSVRVREATGLGRGVLVGPVWDFAGADLDLLLVLGATEGAYPPRPREHPLLHEEVRRRVGLGTMADRRGAERRDHLALLAAAPQVVLTHPLADTRTQRAAEPAAWLLEQTRPRRTSNEQKRTAPPSFQAAACDPTLPAATAGEYDVRLTVPYAPLPPDHPLLVAEPALARGLAAARDRAEGVFGPWTGGLTHPVAAPVSARLDRPLSATALQRYATCPFHYYLEKVLGVRALPEPDDDGYDRAERGTAVHDVLEQLVREAIRRGKPADEAWTQAEHDEAQRLLAAQAERMLAEGKAGRPTVWAVEVARWRGQLRRMLFADDGYRRRLSARPLGVEHGFSDDESLQIELPAGEVRLTGSIDRVDETAGGELVVIDYKSGKSEYYEAFPLEGDAREDADLSDRGTRLQLPLYALAARRDYGKPSTPVSAYYWFVDEADTRRGGRIDDEALRRFRDVLATVVGGIRDGAFPARPGEFHAHFRTFATCRHCDFERACGVARDDLWEGVRNDARVAGYRELAEPSEPGEPADDTGGGA